MLFQNFWNLKQKGRREILKENSEVSFNRRLSVTERLKFIKYTLERSIYSVYNYYRVSRPIIRYYIKKGRINAGYKKHYYIA